MSMYIEADLPGGARAQLVVAVEHIAVRVNDQITLATRPHLTVEQAAELAADLARLSA